jgi:hypothetical protein
MKQLKFHLGDLVDKEMTERLQPEMTRAAGTICLAMRDKASGIIIYGFRANLKADEAFYALDIEDISDNWEILEYDGVTKCFILEEESKLERVGLKTDPVKIALHLIKKEIGI